MGTEEGPRRVSVEEVAEEGTDWAGRGRKTVRFRVTRRRSRKRLRVKAKMVTRGGDPTIWGEEWTVRDQAKEQFEVNTHRQYILIEQLSIYSPTFQSIRDPMSPSPTSPSTAKARIQTRLVPPKPNDISHSALTAAPDHINAPITT